jgi:hypothetical protein
VAVLGFAALNGIALVPMYPILSLDVFYYMAADRIWSVYHENPFVVPPLQAAHDPFFPYTMWGHYPLPYGPLWPWITQAASSFGGGDVARTLVAFKVLCLLGFFLGTAGIAWAAGAIHPQRRLSSICIFAWTPLTLLELVGNGHNDAVCLIPAIVAIGFWARQRSVPTALAGAVSFLLKATMAIVLPALLLASARRELAAHRLGRWLWTHMVPIAILYVLAWAPFRSDAALGFLRETEQYYQSVTSLVATGLPAGTLLREQVLRVLQFVLLGGFAGYYAFQLRFMLREGPDALRAIWRIMLVFFLVVSSFFSPWYFVWPLAIAALLAERRTTTLTILLCLGGLTSYLVPFVVRPALSPMLGPWAFNALGFGIVVGPFLVGLILMRREVSGPGRGLRSVEPTESHDDSSAIRERAVARR